MQVGPVLPQIPFGIPIEEPREMNAVHRRYEYAITPLAWGGCLIVLGGGISLLAFLTDLNQGFKLGSAQLIGMCSIGLGAGTIIVTGATIGINEILVRCGIRN